MFAHAHLDSHSAALTCRAAELLGLEDRTASATSLSWHGVCVSIRGRGGGGRFPSKEMACGVVMS
jgi:hypothetical protein